MENHKRNKTITFIKISKNDKVVRLVLILLQIDQQNNLLVFVIDQLKENDVRKYQQNNKSFR